MQNTQVYTFIICPLVERDVSTPHHFTRKKMEKKKKNSPARSQKGFGCDETLRRRYTLPSSKIWTFCSQVSQHQLQPVVEWLVNLGLGPTGRKTETVQRLFIHEFALTQNTNTQLENCNIFACPKKVHWNISTNVTDSLSVKLIPDEHVSSFVL